MRIPPFFPLPPFRNTLSSCCRQLFPNKGCLPVVINNHMGRRKSTKRSCYCCVCVCVSRMCTKKKRNEREKKTPVFLMCRFGGSTLLQATGSRLVRKGRSSLTTKRTFLSSFHRLPREPTTPPRHAVLTSHNYKSDFSGVSQQCRTKK